MYIVLSNEHSDLGTGDQVLWFGWSRLEQEADKGSAHYHLRTESSIPSAGDWDGDLQKRHGLEKKYNLS